MTNAARTPTYLDSWRKVHRPEALPARSIRLTQKGRKASFGCTGKFPDACHEAVPHSKWAWCEACR